MVHTPSGREVAVKDKSFVFDKVFGTESTQVGSSGFLISSFRQPESAAKNFAVSDVNITLDGATYPG